MAYYLSADGERVGVNAEDQDPGWFLPHSDRDPQSIYRCPQQHVFNDDDWWYQEEGWLCPICKSLYAIEDYGENAQVRAVLCCADEKAAFQVFDPTAIDRALQGIRTLHATLSEPVVIPVDEVTAESFSNDF